MHGKKIAVTRTDVDNIRNLLKIFHAISLKACFREKPTDEQFDRSVEETIDEHVFLQEPLLAASFIMQGVGVTNGQLLLSYEHFEAFKMVAIFNLNSLNVCTPETLEIANNIQFRLLEILAGATEGSTVSDSKSDKSSSNLLN